MALFGLFGNDRAMASGTYAGRQSATDRATAKEQERAARAHAASIRRHREVARKDDQRLAREERANWLDDTSGKRRKGWW